jgi:hypothetical protein
MAGVAGLHDELVQGTGAMLFYKTVLLTAALVICSTPALAQLPPLPPLPLPLPTGTPEDRAACEPDVRKFCESALPDTNRVLQCLQTNRRRISAACRGVLEKYGQ